MNHPDPNPTLLVPRHVVAARPAALSATPGALCLLKALRRRWPASLALGLAAAGLVGGATYLLVPRAKYTAGATLHVATKPKRIIFDPQERETDFRTYQKTQVTLLKNRRVLGNALAKPAVAALATVREQADPEEWLEATLKADFPGGSEVLQVSLSGDRAEDLALIVNAVVKSYMSLVVEEERRERVARLDTLIQLRRKYEVDLTAKRKQLRSLVSDVGLSDQKALALSQQFQAEHLGMAQRERMHAQAEMLKAQAELSVLEAAEGTARPRFAANPGPSAPAAGAGDDPSAVDRDPKVQALVAEADKLGGQLRDGARIARQSQTDPAQVRLRSRLEEINRRLRDQRRAVAETLAQAQAAPRADAPARPGEPAAPSALARARAQVAVWRSYGESMAKDIQRLQGEVKDSTDKGLDLENERADIAVATDVFRKVGAEVEAVNVELGAPERIIILADATVPNRKDELRKLKAAAGGAFGAFALALMGMAYWEYRARRVDGVGQVAEGLGMRLVGTLPALPRRPRLAPPGEPGPRERRWQNRLVESVDAVRALLLHASRRDGTRTVMVASAMKGEGKTSLACHLATSLARGGHRTLLIDGDLRSPACHILFDAPPGPGLCDVLRGERAAEEVIRPGPDDHAPDLMPAGRVDARALQGLARDDLRALLDGLVLRYDFIIIDSAPVLPVADSLVIGQAVDAVIFSILREVSRLPMVYEAHERLAALGVRPIGAVVAGVQETALDYEYQSQLIA